VGLNLLGHAPLDERYLDALCRLADRVDAPFVTDHLCWTGARSDFLLYDPRIFVVLRSWIALMKESFEDTADEILGKAKEIHPELGEFLAAREFLSIQPRIRANVKDRRTYERQMHGWFDGFETLKLINGLTRDFYPKIPLPAALKQILEMQNLECPRRFSGESAPGPEDYMEMLSYLRGLT